MPVDDWAYLAGRGGQPIEDLIATLLRRKYDDAIQMGTAQGDKGIDVVRKTPEGMVVWQVKKFASALVASQWRQIKKSWLRFNRGLGTNDVVAKYYLVTPWTPNEDWLNKFAELTETASFETQWDGSAFIDGLADEFPETYQRFVNGPGVLEQFVTAKALVAGSPIENAGTVSFLDAVDARQSSLNALRDLASDEYYIDFGTQTLGAGEEFPAPSDTHPAVYWRYQPLGGRRFQYEAVIPRTADSSERDPISLQVEFDAEPNSEDAAQIEEWEQWGTPLRNVVASVTTHGGPHDGEHHDSVSLSMEMRMVDLPAFELVGFDEAGERASTLSLECLGITKGATTDWTRFLIATPGRLLTGEVRIADSLENSTLNMKTGDLSGQNPQLVLDEIKHLSDLDDAAKFAIVGGDLHMTGTDYQSPRYSFERMGDIAKLLVELQAHSRSQLLMPDTSAVTEKQVGALKAVAKILGGEPNEIEWSSSILTVPTEPEVFLTELRAGGPLETVESTELTLGDQTLSFDRPVTFRRASVAPLNPDVLAALNAGDKVELHAGDDPRILVTADQNWER